MPNDYRVPGDYRNDYKKIWLYDPDDGSPIASDPIPGKASPAERGDLAAQSFGADEIAKSEQRHSPAESYANGGEGRVGEYSYNGDWLRLAGIGVVMAVTALVCRACGGY